MSAGSEMLSRARPNRIPARWWFALLFALLALLWSGSATGLLSSNDGSHLALARALVLRGETSIEPDRALTLGIDLAEREGRAYSDRPPGTAFTALLAVWLGDRLDAAALVRARDQARAGDPVEPMPACPPYVATYAKRFPDAPPLAKRIATGVLLGLHACLLGLLGLALIDRLLARLALSRGARLFALASLGAATLWGPYSTALFSHVASATMLSGFLLGALALREPPPGWRAHAIALATGLAGGWAIACDYLLVLALVPASLLAIDWRRWPMVLLGGAPIVVATLAYHQAAFGSPFAIGYDFHSTFAFARERESTFGGDPLEGLWVLLGAGRGAGLLAQAPIALAGLLALAWYARRPELRGLGLAALGFVAWLLALCFHATPWGGGTEDHRYLIPILPLAAIGLGLAWEHASARPWLRALLVLLALGSAWRVWSAFLAWREGTLLANAELGTMVALAVLVASLLARRDQS
ncbi:hypothetical protein ACNOYE_07015 [Nannocystaceae bacterium ST9]